MNSQLLASIGGVGLSLLFAYFPGFKSFFDNQTPAVKGLFMIGLMALTAAGTYGLSCVNSPIISGISCDQTGAWELVAAFVAALVANQATYLVAVRPVKGS